MSLAANVPAKNRGRQSRVRGCGGSTRSLSFLLSSSVPRFPLIFENLEVPKLSFSQLVLGTMSSSAHVCSCMFDVVVGESKDALPALYAQYGTILVMCPSANALLAVSTRVWAGIELVFWVGRGYFGVLGASALALTRLCGILC